MGACALRTRATWPTYSYFFTEALKWKTFAKKGTFSPWECNKLSTQKPGIYINSEVDSDAVMVMLDLTVAYWCHSSSKRTNPVFKKMAWNCSSPSLIHWRDLSNCYWGVCRQPGEERNESRCSENRIHELHLQCKRPEPTNRKRQKSWPGTRLPNVETIKVWRCDSHRLTINTKNTIASEKTLF